MSIVLLMGGLLTWLTWSNFSKAWTAHEDAEMAAALARLDGLILDSILHVRSERGDAVAALSQTGSVLKASRDLVARSRSSVDTTIASVMRDAERFATLDATRHAVQTAYAAQTALRAVIDAALDRDVAQRDRALSGQVLQVGERLYTSLMQMAARLEVDLHRVSQQSRPLLMLKNQAWSARSTAGTAAVMVISSFSDRSSVSAASLERMSFALGQTMAHWTSARALRASDPLPAAVVEAVDKAERTYFSGEIHERMQATMRSLVSGTEPAMSLSEAQPYMAARLLTIAEVATAAMSAAASEAAMRAGEARMAAIQHGALLAATLVLVGVGLALAQYRIARPITRMTGTMHALADGRVDVAVPGRDRGDEIGAMAAAVQIFKDNLIRTRALEEETVLARLSAEEQRRSGMRQMADAFEHAVGGVVGQVSSAASALQATATTMRANATHTAARSTEVAAAAEQAATNVTVVAAAAEELGASVQEIGRQVTDSSALARSAVAEADQAADLIQALGTATAKIGDVVALISGIAGQTNLLALNATIEAARAGEAGRGFAVVAAEVKQLATQTARATDDITRQIDQIQGATGRAVNAIGAITSRVREISGVAAAIASAVEQQGAATQEIVRNVSEASEGSRQVTGTITSVARASEETGHAADQVLSAASALSRQSGHLSAEVDRFLGTVRAA
ncbi:methyl-accepting chemotaxis protein [Methylobacterium variabile]|nr:methyl-accepting chemotaxis protein [Methylobacterium variabile]